MKRERRIYRKLKPLAEAREIFLSRFKDAQVGTEVVPVRLALGRVLKNPVKAARSVPAYHSAAMDGLAVRASSTFGALPETPVTLDKASVAPVNTGDPMPEWADSVVMIEKVEEGEGFEIREAVYPWQNVRKTGEDVVRGEILLSARQRIRPWDQGALLAAGVLSVEVFKRPKILILPTGDEIVRPEDAADPLQPGAILEVNGQVLASMAAECGADAVVSAPTPDEPGRIRDALDAGLAADYDAVLIVAGSSAGTEDFTPAILEETGELLVHGVTVMPGKPTLLAAVYPHPNPPPRAGEGRVGAIPVIGVPGYPVSAVVSFREFVKPLLCHLQGLKPADPETVEAVAGRKIPSKIGLEEHVRVVLGEVGGRVVAIPLAGGAGMLTTLVRADGILKIPSELGGLSEGETATVELLSSREALAHRLLAIGSHDLTIDLLASMIKEKSEGRIAISSSNVGSLGGLNAVAKGIAHFAGTHLLDAKTGDYNRSYVRDVLTREPVTLLTLVHRWQGIMVAKRNPKAVKGISDLARSGVSFVNRQAGSGTRILLDYKLRKAGIEPASIAGYRNEEYTHMSVAMAVASGRADAGLGVLAAAKALDLDFIPLARERYDLVMPAALLEDERNKMLVEIIRSDRFAKEVLAMGGYEVEETGRIVPM